MPFTTFKADLATHVAQGTLGEDIIGEGVMIPGFHGQVPLVYADYVASGRAMQSVEQFIATQVLPFYANSHTEASYCGQYITHMRRAARAEIAQACGARAQDAVVFTGAGATAGLNRLISLFGINDARDPVVFIGPYEHHSNILPWRESRAKVVEIPESANGGVDLDALAQASRDHADSDLKIGSFSAASNVTGIITDPDPISRLLRHHGAKVVWDYAGGGPYLPVDMGANGAVAKDAVVLSPHKFPGGPGASGVLLVNQNAVATQKPSWPGGGTVRFVSPWRHDYSADLVAREEAGTPNVIGDIRAALAFLVKDAVGPDQIAEREAEYARMAWSAWEGHPQITVLGSRNSDRLPIFSFMVRDEAGNPVHQQVFTRMLSDVYGIQARGGCACAGPYAHRLLGIDAAASDALFQRLEAGEELEKPGWVRLNFSYLMTPETVQFILQSVVTLAENVQSFLPSYHADPATARFKYAS